MAQTPLGYFHRTDKGRFLYGRPKNYRLAPVISAIPNSTLSLGVSAPLAGATPLAVANTIAAYSVLPTIASMYASPTAPNGGIYAPNPGGGYAVTGTAYARVSSPATLTPSNTWAFGDGTSNTGAGSASSTPKSYVAAGTFPVTLRMRDSLQRDATKFTGPVVPV